jgi:hypothetical protein
MKYLKIQNDGLLDIRLVALMGGTTKAKDKYKIGQFGTGLKYTLAFLFRNNLDFKIFVGTEEVKVHIEKEYIKDEIFEIICINGNRTSITTRMGEDWACWQIIRELWCNALDEGGAVNEITETIEGIENKTIFYIQEDLQVRNVIKEWDKYFIHNQNPIWQNDTYKIYPGGSKLRLYKQGVLIFEDDSAPAIFAYDVSNADINELREFKGTPKYEIARAVSAVDVKTVKIFLDNLTEESYESTMDWDWYQSFSQGWREAIGSGKIITQKTLDDIRSRGSHVDEIALIIVPKSLYLMLCKQFEGIGATHVAGKIGDFYEDFDEKVEAKIKQGLAILDICGYCFHPELEFIYGFFEDKRTMAQVDIKSKKVYISKAFLQKPLFTIVAMLIEENEHFNTGLSDETREFQQYFIDLYTRQLLAAEAIEI